ARGEQLLDFALNSLTIDALVVGEHDNSDRGVLRTVEVSPGKPITAVRCCACGVGCVSDHRCRGFLQGLLGTRLSALAELKLPSAQHDAGCDETDAQALN